MLPSVLIFSGADPSGGAGLVADVQAVSACGAHPLALITALTVQDNDRVYAVHPVDANVVAHQTRVLLNKIPIAAIKIGIVGSRANAEVIAQLIQEIRQGGRDVPVVLDPVLASGHGDALSKEDPVQNLKPLLPLATIILPNLPELARLGEGDIFNERVRSLLKQGVQHVLVKGGHDVGEVVENQWFYQDEKVLWQWPRLVGEFHGSGCTLASALAAYLAKGVPMRTALAYAQRYCQIALEKAYTIADGQKIPARSKEDA
jgi:hydroxymethylpyrimidine/phosphomethylpyrimidine kinase